MRNREWVRENENEKEGERIRKEGVREWKTEKKVKDETGRE